MVCDRYEIKISTNAPVVLGGAIEFHADLYSDGQLKDGNYEFHWRDNSIPQHTYVSRHHPLMKRALRAIGFLLFGK